MLAGDEFMDGERLLKQQSSWQRMVATPSRIRLCAAFVRKRILHIDEEILLRQNARTVPVKIRLPIGDADKLHNGARPAARLQSTEA